VDVTAPCSKKAITKHRYLQRPTFIRHRKDYFSDSISTMILPFPHYIWGNWVWKKLNNETKTTQLLDLGAEIETKSCLPPKPVFILFNFLVSICNPPPWAVWDTGQENSCLFHAACIITAKQDPYNKMLQRAGHVLHRFWVSEIAITLK
jgi:hypothetical protein